MLHLRVTWLRLTSTTFRGAVGLYRDDGSHALASLTNLKFPHLEPSEYARYNGFRTDQRRRQFILCRQVAAIISQVLMDTQILFCSDNRGRPYLQPDGLFCSLSHSDQWVAAAVSYSPVGVDIEMAKPRNFEMLLDSFPEADRAAWSQVAISNRAGWFYRRWTQKEAVFKAGLGGELHPINILPETISELQLSSYQGADFSVSCCTQTRGKIALLLLDSSNLEHRTLPTATDWH